MNKFSIRRLLICVLLIGSVIFNVAAWMSRSFSDYYTDNIFPVITGIYGRFTSLFRVSVGERLLLLLPLLLILFVITLFIKREFAKSYRKVMALVLSVVVAVMSLNCFVLYHCTPLQVTATEGEQYYLEDLATLRDYIVNKCNELSELMPRDADGNVIYDGDMNEAARAAMAGIAGEYKRLGGFYVTPKALTFSGFMSQQYMQGYYFPFSMEANYNDEMYIMNKPFTMCHELAHTHGYIYEDEANFLGFLSCIKSDDIVFVYSGYLGVLNYVNNDFYKAVDKDVYKSHVAISDKVRYDDQYLTDEAWERVEKRALFKTDTVKKAADTFIDTNLKVNGVSSGKVSYTHVVALLLDYYRQNSYN